MAQKGCFGSDADDAYNTYKLSVRPGSVQQLLHLYCNGSWSLERPETWPLPSLRTPCPTLRAFTCSRFCDLCVQGKKMVLLNRRVASSVAIRTHRIRATRKGEQKTRDFQALIVERWQDTFFNALRNHQILPRHKRHCFYSRYRMSSIDNMHTIHLAISGLD
jgi:hypothetical protein